MNQMEPQKGIESSGIREGEFMSAILNKMIGGKASPRR
jgi:hypothetical protein